MEPIDTKIFLEEVRLFFREHADEKQVIKYAKFFKEGYDAYGIPKEIWETQPKIWYDQLNNLLNVEGFLELGDELLESGKYEEASLAIHFLARLQDQYTPTTWERIGQWLENWVRNWAHTDIICGDILSPSLQTGKLNLEELSHWRNSSSKWRRRAVPVSMLGLLKITDDVTPLLTFLSPLMEDEVREVHQGMGWFLREAWKLHPEPVEAFLLQWKETAPRLIYQYATEKMTPEQKERFRKSKSKLTKVSMKAEGSL